MLLKQITEFPDHQPKMLLDDLASEVIPRTLVNRRCDLVEVIYCLVLHHLLVKLAIQASLVKQGVLPALRVVARLIFAAFVLLAEVYLFHWGDFFAYSLAQILVRNLSIAILVKPLVKRLHLSGLCIKAPTPDKLIEAIPLDIVASCQLPFDERLLDSLILIESSRNESLA